MSSLTKTDISKMKQFIADLLDVAGFPGMREDLEALRAHQVHLERVSTGIIITKEYKK